MAAYQASPQTSVFSEDMDSISITLKKQAHQKSSSSNHQKNVLQGRKTFAFWTLVGLLFILAIGNLILTMTILGVLRIGQGMQSVELVPNEETVKLFGLIDLDNLYKRDGKIEGFYDIPVEIVSDDSVNINLLTRTGRTTNKVKIDKNGTSFKGLNSFEVKSSKKTIFSSPEPNFDSLKSVKTLYSKQLETNKIKSPVKGDLSIEGDELVLKGAEGTLITASGAFINADQDVQLQSSNGSIILEGNSGKIQISKLILSKSITRTQFKVCVCMPQGKLFKIPIANADEPVYCHHFDKNPQNNPCM